MDWLTIDWSAVNWLDVSGHFGYTFVMFGMLLIGKKNIWGWVCRFFGEITWLIIGILMGMSSIYVWEIVFIGLDIRGFLLWRKDKLEEKVCKKCQQSL